MHGAGSQMATYRALSARLARQPYEFAQTAAAYTEGYNGRKYARTSVYH